MLVSPVNPPKLFARNAAGRMVQIAGRPGEIGRFENMIVPDAHEIRRLRPAVTFLEKLKPAPFRVATRNSYDRHTRSVAPTDRPTPFSQRDNLPLFQEF